MEKAKEELSVEEVRAECWRITESAYAECDRAVERAHAEYRHKVAEAYKERNRICKPSLDELAKARERARKERVR